MHGKISAVISKLASSSVFCKSLYGVLLVGYVASFSDFLFHALAITPRMLFPPNFWLWTVFTYFVAERNVLILLADFLCVHLCGSVLEPLWTPLELVTYLIIVNCSVAVSTTLFLFILYFFVESSELLFSCTVHGLFGFVGALLVAVKQVVPDSTLLNAPTGRLTNSHLPALVFMGAAIFCMVKIIRWVSLYMYLSGAFLGWIYLRYYQPHPNGSKGDMSDHFSFASFFPGAIQGPVEVLSGFLYRVFIRIGVCKPAIRHFDVSQLQTVSVQLPGMEPQDAERRRQKALKDLTERLNKAKEQQVPAWPTLESDSRAVLQMESPVTHALASPALTEGSSTLSGVGKSDGLSEMIPEDQFHDTTVELTSDSESTLKGPGSGSSKGSTTRPKLVLNMSGSETEQG